MQVGINRKRKVEANCGSPPELRLHEFLQKRLKGGAAGGKAVASSAVEALQKHQSVAKACLKNDTGVTLPALSDVVAPPSIAAAAVKDASSFARAIPKRPEVRETDGVTLFTNNPPFPLARIFKPSERGVVCEMISCSLSAMAPYLAEC